MTVQAIADAVETAWHGHHGGGRIEVPVGTVAALALLHLKEPTKANQDALAHRLTSLDGPGLLQYLERIWAARWISDPYLVDVARPIHSWITGEPSEQTVIAVRAVVAAALKRGLLQATASSDPYTRAMDDVLGHVVTTLRSRGARRGLGEYHTPGPVAEAMARLVLADGVEPGQSIDDMAAGTGGLLRAAAQFLRERGRDPHEFVWSMGELDPVSAACCAVNAMIWDLGPNVLVFCGDSLAQGNGPDLAAQHRAGVLAHHAQVLGTARIVAAIWDAEALLSDRRPRRGTAASRRPGPGRPSSGRSDSRRPGPGRPGSGQDGGGR